MKKGNREGTHYTRADKNKGKEFRSFHDIYISLDVIKEYDQNYNLQSHKVRDFSLFLNNLEIDADSFKRPKSPTIMLVDMEEHEDGYDAQVEYTVMSLYDEKGKGFRKLPQKLVMDSSKDGIIVPQRHFAFNADGAAIVEEFIKSYYLNDTERVHGTENFYKDCQKGVFSLKYKKRYQWLIERVLANMDALGHKEKDIEEQRLVFWKNIVAKTAAEGGCFSDYLDWFAMPKAIYEIDENDINDENILDLMIINDAFQQELDDFITRWEDINKAFYDFKHEDQVDVEKQIKEGAIDVTNYIERSERAATEEFLKIYNEETYLEVTQGGLPKGDRGLRDRFNKYIESCIHRDLEKLIIGMQLQGMDQDQIIRALAIHKERREILKKAIRFVDCIKSGN